MSRRLKALPDVQLYFLSLPRFSLAARDIAANLITFLPFLLTFKKLLNRIKPALIYGNTIRSALPVVIARKLGYATLVHYHECNVTGMTGQLLAKLVNVAADRNIFVCRFALESYTIFSPDVMSKSIVIHNGINQPAVGGKDVEPEAFRGGEPKLLSVAQLATHKRIIDLIEAMPAICSVYPRARLVVLGEGEMRQALENRIKELKLEECVLLPGYLNDITSLVSATDIFLAPFEKEACNMAVIEAMAAGKPVVAADGGGMPELVSEGETGYLYPSGDIPQLLERVMQLTDSAALRQQLGEAATRRVARKFNLPTQMKLILLEIEAIARSDKGQTR
jgi:glycosyltransferase involved in cell wall biosynthesis